MCRTFRRGLDVAHVGGPLTAEPGSQPLGVGLRGVSGKQWVKRAPGDRLGLPSSEDGLRRGQSALSHLPRGTQQGREGPEGEHRSRGSSRPPAALGGKLKREGDKQEAFKAETREESWQHLPLFRRQQGRREPRGRPAKPVETSVVSGEGTTVCVSVLGSSKAPTRQSHVLCFNDMGFRSLQLTRHEVGQWNDLRLLIRKGSTARS